MHRLALLAFVALMATSCVASVEPIEEITLDIDAPELTGRTALAEAQGQPHVLWFWGAH